MTSPVEELRPINALTATQVEQLCQLYQEEWWSAGRTLEESRAIVQNSSLVIGFVDRQERLVAFCRVLTDFVVHAAVFDVIVAAEARGTGLGRRLLDAVTQHPRLQPVRSLWLCCLPELVPFYDKWGFRMPHRDLIWRQKARTGIEGQGAEGQGVDGTGAR